MTDSIPSNPPVVPIVETTAVQLTRIEGVANLIAERVSDLRGRVDGHDTRFGHIDEKVDRHDSRIQSLEEGAAAGEKTAVALALALKEAKETADATARNELEKENRKADTAWSPIQRLVLFAAGAMGLFQLYQTFIPGTK